MKRTIWIYEYKDDDTPIGATFFEGTMEELLEKGDSFDLPHLHPDWHWKIGILEEREDKDF